MTAAPAPAASPTQPPERHATWLELFFDLVAIAGMSALAHLLEESTSATGLLTYGVAFTAFWMVWACFTMYGNVAGDKTRRAPMLIGMGMLVVMAAAVPGIEGERATIFALAYIIGRTVATRAWRPDRIVVDLPILQAGAGVTPWIISLWVDGRARYVLWGIGLGLDLWLLLTARRHDVLSRYNARLAQLRERRARRLQLRKALGDEAPQVSRRQRDLPEEVVAANADLPHLGERLGLFVLIVLGEGLIQLIAAAHKAEWGMPLLIAGAGVFLLVVGLWAIAVERGYAGVALLRSTELAPRLAWVAHLFSTGLLVALAAGLSPLVADPSAEVVGHELRVAVLTYAGYTVVCLITLVAATPGGVRARLLAAAPLTPMVVAALAVALIPGLHAIPAIWLLTGGVLAVVAIDHRRRPGHREPRMIGAALPTGGAA